MELHQGTYQRHRNRLKAQLSRHWPEVLGLLGLGSVTLLELLIDYGSPRTVANQAEAAGALMRKLAKALWPVARGQAFDADKLFDRPGPDRRQLTGNGGGGDGNPTPEAAPMMTRAETAQRGFRRGDLRRSLGA